MTKGSIRIRYPAACTRNNFDADSLHVVVFALGSCLAEAPAAALYRDMHMVVDATTCLRRPLDLLPPNLYFRPATHTSTGLNHDSTTVFQTWVLHQMDALASSYLSFVVRTKEFAIASFSSTFRFSKAASLPFISGYMPLYVG